MTTYDPNSLFGHGIRISELEKNGERDYLNIDANRDQINANLKGIENCWKEITKLQNKLKFHLNRLSNEIAELKERVIDDERYISENMNIKEVLRVLFQEKININKGNRRFKSINALFEYLLAKLDGVPKEQTVKEPTPALDALLHGIDPAFLKASGGVDKPKPKHQITGERCDICPVKPIIFNGEELCPLEKCIEPKEEDRLPSGTGTEPREDEKTGLCAFPNCDEIGILRANGKMKCELHYYSIDEKPPEPIFNEEEIWGDEPREDEPKSRHMWSHLTEVAYCDICGKFAHQVGYDSECIN